MSNGEFWTPEYLEKPGSHLAHEILHTYYIKRGL